MDCAWVRLPRFRTKLIPLVLGAGIFTWFIYSLSGPPLEGPFAHRNKPGYRPSPRLRPYPPPLAHTVWNSRAEQVKEAFVHAYRGYQQHAASSDELLPITNTSSNHFNGWGLQLIDALDTMWIMGLRDDFQDAMPLVAAMTFHLPDTEYAPFFETVIRYLGGLLSAHALSGEPALLARADDLGKMLLPVFKTPHGLPMYAVNTVTGATRAGWSSEVLWAEALSCQLEYKYLAHLTGRQEYFDHVEHIIDIMQAAKIKDGMFPTKWNMQSGKPSNDQFSVGAFADSAHEYLLKQWLLTSRSETKAMKLYLKAASGILNHLLYLTPNRQLLYVTDTSGTNATPSHTFEHLSCFLPGLLALGAHTLPLSEDDKELHNWAAQGLAYTCWITYADHATGLGPDEMLMEDWDDDPTGANGRWIDHVKQWKREGSPGGVPPGLREVQTRKHTERDYNASKGGYFLRPESVESFYLLWRLTRDETWRERGWAVFESIEREAKTPSGYASLSSVEISPAHKKNEMPSFFMAETLKYLYLLFREEDVIPLNQWVFNTEAHPLPIFQWMDWERERYRIP
ncbi:glycoside hydrolase family 47 protein [Phanerochaete carnosa HHB-10118-sp]|uniref:alpha-1,2-Mannosidase n=1 Tax=Phanerochaete carnosa (strain HHB-10118-sp) TaxID=650164 RepID=K5WIV5_PHACS|nr:glycoside hydrolase family 47 protein [Phanerochaete carnosa HHB-10118-sp]EKM50182.1 glycoside hydrolase family 47 protein [Phanerochaete carnosa HHB-10118-sp]